jgi:lysophospholipase L1-like esterase
MDVEVLVKRMNLNFWRINMSMNLLKGKISKICLAGWVCLHSYSIVHGQQVDSSFHNYLYDSRLAYFKALPAKKGTTVFWGDSITHWGDWAEFTGFKKVINRGISGDNTYGLLGRIDEVIRHQPSRLFILIGTNDINKKIPYQYIVNNYRRIIDQVKTLSPRTRIFVQSVFPINNQLIGRQYYSGTNEEIMRLNSALKQLSSEAGVAYLDIYDALLDASGQLDTKYTYDGLHLSGMGYQAWVGYLKSKKNL